MTWCVPKDRSIYVAENFRTAEQLEDIASKLETIARRSPEPVCFEFCSLFADVDVFAAMAFVKRMRRNVPELITVTRLDTCGSAIVVLQAGARRLITRAGGMIFRDPITFRNSEIPARIFSDEEQRRLQVAAIESAQLIADRSRLSMAMIAHFRSRRHILGPDKILEYFLADGVKDAPLWNFTG